MDTDKLEAIESEDEELDDPYVHIVSTEEFVDNVERIKQEQKDDRSKPNED